MSRPFAVALTVLMLAATNSAFAVDYLDFSRTTLLTCLHPTVDSSSAKAEYVNPPTANAETTTSRVRVFYKGLIKANSLLVEVFHRQAGTISQMKVEVLEDSSATGTRSCKFVEGWQDL